jgi:hypothetical protein
MIFLDATTHQAPGENFRTGDMLNPTSWYVTKALEGDQAAVTKLLEGGIVLHHTLSEDEKLLGSHWVSQADGWHEVADGTEAERVAALAGKALNELRLQWKARDRVVRASNNHELATDANQTTEARLRALHELITGESNG